MIYLATKTATVIHAVAPATNYDLVPAIILPANRLAIGDKLEMSLFVRQDVGTDTAGQSMQYEFVLDEGLPSEQSIFVANNTAVLAVSSPACNIVSVNLIVGTDGRLYQINSSDVTAGNTTAVSLDLDGKVNSAIPTQSLGISALALNPVSGVAAGTPLPIDRLVKHTLSVRMQFVHANVNNFVTLLGFNLKWYQFNANN